MGCFCRHDVAALAALTAQLNAAISSATSVSVSAALTADAGIAAAMPAACLLATPATLRVTALAAALAALGLPAAPWNPDPAWLELALPVLPMPPTAMATLVGLANLRAQAQAVFGLDLLDPAASLPFARLCATLSARVAAAAALGASASASATLAASLDASASATLQGLAALALALDRIELALAAPVLDIALYRIDPVWRGFLRRIEALLPLIAALLLLGLDPAVDFTASLAASFRALLAIRLPTAAPAMVQLSATLNAVATLRASLGIDPLAAGTVVLVERLSLRISSLPAAALAALADALAGLVPCPTLAITPDVVAIAASLNPLAVAGLAWTPPPIAALPAIGVGAVAVGLAASLSATLGITASLSPCADGCDAARLARAIA